MIDTPDTPDIPDSRENPETSSRRRDSSNARRPRRPSNDGYNNRMRYGNKATNPTTTNDINHDTSRETDSAEITDEANVAGQSGNINSRSSNHNESMEPRNSQARSQIRPPRVNHAERVERLKRLEQSGRLERSKRRPERSEQSGRTERSSSVYRDSSSRSSLRPGRKTGDSIPTKMMPDFFSGLLSGRRALLSYFARTIILIPTYNERENIVRLINSIHGLYPEVYILVIDDSSPDGTAEVVRELGRRNRKIMLLDKGKKEGIGKAYIRGFLHTIELAKGLAIDYVVQMDADFSHDPVYLTPMLSAIRTADWVIGSRYAQGVNVVNWPMKRILLSFFANRYVNAVTGIGIKDATAGFKIFRLSVLRQIDLRKVVSNGYVFQIEMNYILKRLGFKVQEVPIIFRDRQVGDSKISGSIIREAMFRVLWFPFKNVKSYRRRVL